MTDPLQALQSILQGGNLPVNNLSSSSRYSRVGTAVMLNEQSGDKIIYLKRRFIPAAENILTKTEHLVREGNRLDNLTASYIGDPEQFWQIADANNAMAPEELTETPGGKLSIP
ncbi:MAG: LysM domain-containing protein [Chitinophagaceae bacterium]